MARSKNGSTFEGALKDGPAGAGAFAAAVLVDATGSASEIRVTAAKSSCMVSLLRRPNGSGDYFGLSKALDARQPQHLTAITVLFLRFFLLSKPVARQHMSSTKSAVTPEALLRRAIYLPEQFALRPLRNDNKLPIIHLSEDDAGCMRAIDQARHCRRRTVMDSFEPADSSLSPLAWTQVIREAHIDPVVELFNQLKADDKPALYCDCEVISEGAFRNCRLRL